MGKDREYHDDGTYTDRYDDYRETSITYNQDGSVRESSREESVIPFGNALGLDAEVRVTYDGDGNQINIQNLEDD
jgi:hypothetical protein